MVTIKIISCFAIEVEICMYLRDILFMMVDHCREVFAVLGTVCGVHHFLSPSASLSFFLSPALPPLSEFLLLPLTHSLSLSSVPQIWSSILSLTYIMDPLSQLSAILTTGLPPLSLGEGALTPSLPPPPPPRVPTPSHRHSQTEIPVHIVMFL